MDKAQRSSTHSPDQPVMNPNLHHAHISDDRASGPQKLDACLDGPRVKAQQTDKVKVGGRMDDPADNREHDGIEALTLKLFFDHLKAPSGDRVSLPHVWFRSGCVHVRDRGDDVRCADRDDDPKSAAAQPDA
jgi:hypothetical protein